MSQFDELKHEIAVLRREVELLRDTNLARVQYGRPVMVVRRDSMGVHFEDAPQRRDTVEDIGAGRSKAEQGGATRCVTDRDIERAMWEGEG
jgi:hypothetical protein